MRLKGQMETDFSEQESLKAFLDRLHGAYNRREFLHTDPLVHLYDYDDDGDREVAGFITASLAYGRVAQINRSVAAVLRKLSPSPARFIAAASPADLRALFSDFKHRFTTGEELAQMLFGLGETVRSRKSLNACFLEGMKRDDGTILPALTAFIETIKAASGGSRNSLLASPSGGSACKRLNLYLRWMVRCDEVDPGGWQGIPRSMLLVPLDTHMHRAAQVLGLTGRRQAQGMKTVLEITDRFRMLEPDDPVRYDFALTRPGIIGAGEAKLFSSLFDGGFARRPFNLESELS